MPSVSAVSTLCALIVGSLAIQEEACAEDDVLTEDLEVVLLQSRFDLETGALEASDTRKVSTNAAPTQKKQWMHEGEVSGAEFPVLEPEAVQWVASFMQPEKYVGSFYPQGTVAIAGKGIGQAFDWALSDVDPMCAKGPDSTAPGSCSLRIHDGALCNAVDDTYMVEVRYIPKRAEHNKWSADAEGFFVNTGYQNYDLLGKILTIHDRRGEAMACGTINPGNLRINAMVPYVGYTGPHQVFKSSFYIRTLRGANYASKQIMKWRLMGVDPRCSERGSKDSWNSCGVILTKGKTCGAEAGASLWNLSYYHMDPWQSVKYKTISGSLGVGTVQQGGEVLTGVDLIEMLGRAVIAHDYDGNPIACGIAAPLVTVVNAFGRHVEYKGGLNVSGWVKIRLSRVAPASGLELSWVLYGVDPRCTADSKKVKPGACGVQIRRGMSCKSIGATFKDTAKFSDTDPWDSEHYEFYPEDSRSEGIRVNINVGLSTSDILGRTVVVNDFDGQAVACGIINLADAFY